MLDLELARSRLVGVAGLHLGDHFAALVAQAARFIERLRGARAHEAAVALGERQLLGQRTREFARERTVVGPELGPATRQRRRRVEGALEDRG